MDGFFKKNNDYCSKCKLHENCKNPKLSYYGEGNKKVLIINDFTSFQDDKKGYSLSGNKAFLLKEYLKEININLDKDCWRVNSVSCYSNKKPTSLQRKQCKEHLKEIINELKPEKILCLGENSFHSLIGHKESVTKYVNKWYNWIIPDQEYKCYIAVTYDPFDYLQEEIEKNNKTIEKDFIKQLKNFFEFNEPFFSLNEKFILFEKYEKELFYKLDNIKENDIVVFDIETTGLKPYDKDHEIVCVGLSIINNDKIINSFCFNLDNEEIKKKWISILQNKNIKKIAHNASFEHKWNKVILNTNTTNWYWDTMLSQHIIDNRKGITGLKFLTYVNFGISEYNKDVKKVIEANEYGFNTLKSLDKKVLYKYCVLDTIYTAELYLKQKQQLKNINANKFFLECAIELSNIEINGWNTDKEYFIKMSNRLSKKSEIIQNKIKETKEYLLYKRKTKEELNINSPKQLKELFFDFLKLKPNKYTITGNASVDEEALSNMTNNLAQLIIQDRKIKKIKTTYLDNYVNEISEDNKIHCFYQLHNVKSYRGSSSLPNMQNVPKHNKEAVRIIRSGIIPRKNNILLEADYTSLEVIIAACYHKDPEMIKYLQGHGDMHKDVASQIFLLDKKDINKDQRFIAKNSFVFPQFYGSWYKECATNIWKAIDEKTKEYLKNKNLNTYSKYEKHIKEVEYNFWNVKFKVYNQWKWDTWNQYLKTGKIISKTGFIYNNPMRKNDVLNYPIQGSAFHCLLWSLKTINKWLKEKKMKSLILGQIHDSIIMDIVPEELELIKSKLQYVMCEQIREEWDWIIVPLKIEIETSDENWYKIK